MKIIATLTIVMVSFTLLFAQDFTLVGPSVDWNSITNTSMAGNSNQGIAAGRMKQLNDSMFVYFHNRSSFNGSEVYSRVLVVTIENAGTYNTEEIYDESYTLGSGTTFFSEMVTDVITHNEAIYMIKNESVGSYSGTAVQKFIQDNGTWQLDGAFGTSGKWTSSGINADFQFAMGTIELNTPVLYAQTGFPIQQIGRCAILNDGQGHAYSFITQNAGQHFSFVGDIVTIGSDTYIADNGYDVNGNGDYTPVTRIAKVSAGNLATSFGTNGYLWMSWSNQTTGLNSSIIHKILPTSDNKLLVVGNRYEFNASANNWFPKGRISKITTDGTFDNAFGFSGTFNIDAGFGRSDFNAAYEKDGNYFIAGYSGAASFSLSTGLIIQLNSNGVLNTMVGDAGMIRLSPNNVSGILSMYERANGNWVLNVLENNSSQRIGVGAYTFGTPTTSLTEQALNQASLYPNPTSNMLHIELNEPSSIQIYNSLGKLVMQQEELTNFTIDVSGLENGVYSVKAGNKTQRFVKQ